MYKRIWLLPALCLALACNTKKSGTPASGKPDPLAVNMDTTVNPADDFFQYANGGWINRNPIPGEESRWGIGNLVEEENKKRMREICEKAAAGKNEAGSNEQKIGDFWAIAMDSAKIEQQGLSALKPILQQIDSLTDLNGFIQKNGELGRIGIRGLFTFAVSQDQKNSDKHALYSWQGGIGLPDREYYFENDSTTKAVRAAYTTYMHKMLVLLGKDSAQAAASVNNIMAMETKIATAHRKLADLRDPYANYNKMAIADLSKLTPSVNWPAYIAARGIKGTDTVIVGQPEYFKMAETVLKTTSLETLKDYLRLDAAETFMEALPDTFGRTLFAYEKTLSGAKDRKIRWKRVMETQEALMGEMMGQVFVKEFFTETAKKRYETMVEAVRTALHDRIAALSWMSDSTRQKAFHKLAAMKKKVGYPDKWKDFSGMQIGRESFVQNLSNAIRWLDDYQMNKLGKPVDREEWDIFPQTYNAYYNPSNNEIVLPAGIFTVPGYRDEELDDATVYGLSAASTIGHEITHGFDDEGRQYDALGNLQNWWQKKDEEEFKKRADVMVQLFNNIEVIDKMHINGKATLGENIADLGGAILGLEAFKKTEQYKKGTPTAGLTPVQRYFLGYALGWLGHIKDAALKHQLMTNVHAPAKYRVNGIFPNVDDFYTAFKIPPGSKMYLEEGKRVRIW